MEEKDGYKLSFICCDKQKPFVLNKNGITLLDITKELTFPDECKPNFEFICEAIITYLMTWQHSVNSASYVNNINNVLSTSWERLLDVRDYNILLNFISRFGLTKEDILKNKSDVIEKLRNLYICCKSCRIDTMKKAVQLFIASVISNSTSNEINKILDKLKDTRSEKN